MASIITGRNASTGPGRPIPMTSSPPQPPLEDRDDHAERRARGQQVHHRRGERDEQAAEGEHQQQEAEQDDHADEQRQLAGEHRRRSRRRSRSGRRRRPSRRCPASAAGTTSSRRWLIRSLVCLVLRRGASGRPGRSPTVAGLVGSARRRRRRRPRALLGRSAERCRAPACPSAARRCGDELQRAVEAGPEALGEQVVGLARGGATTGRCPRRRSRAAATGTGWRAASITTVARDGERLGWRCDERGPAGPEALGVRVVRACSAQPPPLARG